MNDQKYQLTVRKGPEPGKVYDLASVSMTIGRDPMSEITINDPEVSRRHARLIGTVTGYRIQDLGSTNGTFVDGERLSGEPFNLKAGQVISIGGGVELVYQPVASVDDQSVTMIDADVASLGVVSSQPPFEAEAGEEIAAQIDESDFVEAEAGEENIAQIDESDIIENEEVEIAEMAFEPTLDETTSEASEVEQSAVEPSDDSVSPATVWDTPRAEESPLVEEPLHAEDEPFPEPIQSDSYEAGDFSEPVVIPHQGEEIRPPEKGQDSSRRRISTIIAAAILLLICCCCSSLLFFYYYGGDWLLRQLGLLP